MKFLCTEDFIKWRFKCVFLGNCQMIFSFRIFMDFSSISYGPMALACCCVDVLAHVISTHLEVLWHSFSLKFILFSLWDLASFLYIFWQSSSLWDSLMLNYLLSTSCSFLDMSWAVFLLPFTNNHFSCRQYLFHDPSHPLFVYLSLWTLISYY